MWSPALTGEMGTKTKRIETGESDMRLGNIALAGLLVAAIAITITQMPDIQRYLKMKMM